MAFFAIAVPLVVVTVCSSGLLPARASSPLRGLLTQAREAAQVAPRPRATRQSFARPGQTTLLASRFRPKLTRRLLNRKNAQPSPGRAGMRWRSRTPGFQTRPGRPTGRDGGYPAACLRWRCTSSSAGINRRGSLARPADQRRIPHRSELSNAGPDRISSGHYYRSVDRYYRLPRGNELGASVLAIDAQRQLD